MNVQEPQPCRKITLLHLQFRKITWNLKDTGEGRWWKLWSLGELLLLFTLSWCRLRAAFLQQPSFRTLQAEAVPVSVPAIISNPGDPHQALLRIVSPYSTRVVGASAAQQIPTRYGDACLSLLWSPPNLYSLWWSLILCANLEGVLRWDSHLNQWALYKQIALRDVDESYLIS